MRRLLLLLPVGAAWAAELRSVEPRYVVAEPGVVLRVTPGGAPIALVPYGERVTAVLSSAAPQTVSEGTPGHWIVVSAGQERGWAFDGWLLPMPAPPEPCASFTAWAAQWERAGPELAEVRSAQPGDVRRSQVYAEGMSLVVEPEGGELWLPRVGLAQAWAAARRCAPGLEDATGSGWPPVLTRSDLSLRVSRSRLRVLPAAGGAALLSLDRVEDGVRVRWRE